MLSNRQLWSIALLLFAGDVGTTWFALTFLNSFAEANPLVVTLADMIGLLPALLAVKVGFIAVMIGLSKTHKEEHRWFIPALASILYVPVVVWNITLLLSVL